jgi:hypothetical protein
MSERKGKETIVSERKEDDVRKIERRLCLPVDSILAALLLLVFTGATKTYIKMLGLIWGRGKNV